MWLTAIVALDFFVFWWLTDLIVSQFPIRPIIQWLPRGFVTLLLYLPNAILVALYFIIVVLPPSRSFRSWSFWDFLRKTVTVTGQPLHKEQVIYAVCPHGVHGEGAILYFVLNSVYLHVVPVATSLLFYIPICREFMQLAGAVPANAHDIVELLDAGKSILMMPEGLRGLLNRDLSVLQRRKGFIRLARTNQNHGQLSIVPVYIAGTHEMYTTYNVWPWMQGLLLKHFYYPWPILNWGSFGFWPRTNHPIQVRFGEPIKVGNREVDEIHEEFIASFQGLRGQSM